MNNENRKSSINNRQLLFINHYSLNSVHGLEHIFMLREDTDTEFFTDTRHILLDHAERANCIFDVHEHDEGEEFLHDLLTHVENIAIAVGQFLRNAGDDAGLVLPERGHDDATFRLIEVLECARMFGHVFGFFRSKPADRLEYDLFHSIIACARTQLFFGFLYDLADLIFGDGHEKLLVCFDWIIKI